MSRAFTSPRWILTAALGLTLASCVTPPPRNSANFDELRADIAYLSAPEMQGREPGGVAEIPVSGFLIDRMEQAGLTPAFSAQADAKHGGWGQPVAMYQRIRGNAKLTFKRNGKVLSQPEGRLSLIGIEPKITLQNAPILFLGRGNAELAAKQDLTGAIVMLQAAPNEAERAQREAWLADAGALGVIELVRGGEAFAALNNEFEYRHFFRPSQAIDPIIGTKRTRFTAIMGEERAVSLIAQGGGDWDKWLLRSSFPDFAGKWLRSVVDLDLETEIQHIESQNIGGVIRGQKPGSGAIFFIAHWDHLGHCVRKSGLPDVVCPGAVDNASGIAAILQIAEALAETKHDRDIYFVATTGEEHGFAGAATLLAKSPAPTQSIVGLFNLDMLAIAPAKTPVAVVGWNGDPFDLGIAKVLAQQGLERSESALAETFLSRQDGWVFVQAGLPARMVNSSYGDEWALNAFLANGYHSPLDHYTPSIELGGALQDIDLHIALGRFFASERTYPKPSPGAN